MWQLAFTPGSLNHKLDEGTLTAEEFYERLCAEFGRRPDYRKVCRAANDIFTPNEPALDLVEQLSAAGWRLGLLSNTSLLHWSYFTDGRYRTLPHLFECHTLSFRLKLMKPGLEIYRVAAETAGVRTDEVFYIDDIAANVEGARQAGFDAVLFTSVPQLMADLRERGINV